MELTIERTDSPLGLVDAVWTNDGLCAIDFASCRTRMEGFLTARFGALDWVEAGPGEATARLRAYFGGELDAFEGLALDPGGTAFQRSVWTQLCDLRPGTTATYAQIANAVGRPSAARAVGAANGRNPIALAIPCHRIVGANGALTGYAGGLERKRWLLEHEGAGNEKVPAWH